MNASIDMGDVFSRGGRWWSDAKVSWYIQCALRITEVNTHAVTSIRIWTNITVDFSGWSNGVHGPHLCTVQVFPRAFLKMRRRGCAPMLPSTLLPRKCQTQYRIIKLTVF